MWCELLVRAFWSHNTVAEMEEQVKVRSKWLAFRTAHKQELAHAHGNALTSPSGSKAPPLNILLLRISSPTDQHCSHSSNCYFFVTLCEVKETYSGWIQARGLQVAKVNGEGKSWALNG